MSFQKIYDEAVAQKGEEALADLLPQPKTNAELLAVPDADYLAEMAKCIFRSGFVWKIVEHKWPDFERVFVSFNQHRC